MLIPLPFLGSQICTHASISSIVPLQPSDCISTCWPMPLPSALRGQGWLIGLGCKQTATLPTCKSHHKIQQRYTSNGSWSSASTGLGCPDAKDSHSLNDPLRLSCSREGAKERIWVNCLEKTRCSVELPDPVAGSKMFCPYGLTRSIAFEHSIQIEVALAFS